MIGILDIGMGNLQSVANAIYSLGYDSEFIFNKEGLGGITHLIIPGVGAYGKAMEIIHQRELLEPLREFALQLKKPVLGLCLGMQLLAADGSEGGHTAGLDIIKGHVVKFPELARLSLPHIGWNTVQFKVVHPVFKKVKDLKDFYFVHSYYYLCQDEGNVLAETEYGIKFPSIVGENNVLGFQFHPEKSQTNGLLLLENFCEWDGLC